MSDTLLERVELLDPAEAMDPPALDMRHVDQVLTEVERRLDEPAWRRTGWRPAVVFAASFVIVLLAVGGLALLLSRSATPEPADVPPTTPTATTSLPSTSIPPTTEAPSDRQGDGAVTSLGTLTWLQLEGTRDTLPTPHLISDPDGGYMVLEGASPNPGAQDVGLSVLWRSPDAATWEKEELTALTGLEWVEFDVPGLGDAPGWALSYSGSGPTLLRQTDDSWVPVELPDPELPPVEGLAWRVDPAAHPIVSGEITVVHATIRGRVPWEDYFGMRDYNGIEEPNWPEVDESDGTIRFFDDDDSLLAILAVERDGNAVRFVNVENGAVVHEVVFGDGVDAETTTRIADLDELELYGAWSSTGEAAFQYQPAPWQGFGFAVGIPDGGFAYYLHSPEGGGVSIPQVWTSSDGVAWAAEGPPSFLGDSVAADVVVQQTAAGIRAAVGDFENAVGWMSQDGVTWEQDPVLPGYARVFEADFGFVATAEVEDEGQLRYWFWVSSDGRSWERVQSPPGSHDPAWAGAARDVLYLGVTEDSGSRSLWIGRFES